MKLKLYGSRYMITWAEKLYLSKKLKNKDLIKVKSDIESNSLKKSLYCISFASNQDNLFDIYNSNQLRYNYYQNHNDYILGLADNREEAIGLIIEIIEEIYEKTGEFKVREYFK